MSYKINKTDGTLLIDLIDGVQNTSATDITLIGKNSTGFGEAFNENFVKILENFAATNAPASPLEGQLWFDTTTDTLKVFDGDDFKNAGGAYVEASQPSMAQGDLWYNTTRKQIYTYDGDNLQLVGPLYTGTQGITGSIPDTIVDVQGFERSVVKHFIAGTLLGIESNLEFKIASTNQDDVIEGLETDIDNNRIVKRGFTILDDDYKIRGTVTDADGIGGVDITKLVRTDVTSTIDANLIIRGNDGLKFSSVHKQNYENTNFVYRNLVPNDDLSIKVIGTATGTNEADAIKIDSSNAFVGIYNSSPEAMLHIGSSSLPGNLIVEGDLTVKGSNTYIESTTLKVQDKTIELGILEDSTTANNIAIDGAGIVVQSLEGSKDLTWENATGAWTSNQDFNLTATKQYKINNNIVLTETELGSSVTSAPGLETLGTLTTFGTQFLTITGTTISASNGQHLNLAPAGDVVINTSIVRGVVDGNTNDSVTTKGYVDTETNKTDLGFSMDATGLGNTAIAGYLNTMFPDNAAGRLCRVLATTYTYTGTTDVESSKTITSVSVDRAGGSENQSVVQNIEFTDAVTSVTATPTRVVKTFVWSGAAWLFQA